MLPSGIRPCFVSTKHCMSVRQSGRTVPTTAMAPAGYGEQRINVKQYHNGAVLVAALAPTFTLSYAVAPGHGIITRPGGNVRNVVRRTRVTPQEEMPFTVTPAHGCRYITPPPEEPVTSGTRSECPQQPTQLSAGWHWQRSGKGRCMSEMGLRGRLPRPRPRQQRHRGGAGGQMRAAVWRIAVAVRWGGSGAGWGWV